MLIKNMVCSMRTRLYIYVSMLLAFLSGCQQPYQVEFDFALNREELRFTKAESKSYFLVYSTGTWTVEFDHPVSWATLSRTSGNGNQQVSVACLQNTGVSRGVNIIITNNDGRQKKVALSQEAALSDVYYMISGADLQLLAKGTGISLAAETNVPEDLFSEITLQFEPADAREWISDVKVSPTGVSCVVADYLGQEWREAVLGIYFPAAEWDDSRCKAFVNIRQSVMNPQITLPQTHELDQVGAPSSVAIECNWAADFYTYDMSTITFSDPTWVSAVYDAEAQSIVITPQRNKSGQVRENQMTCYLKDLEGNILDEASVTLTQDIFDGIDPVDAVALYSGERYANCYLIEDTDAKVWWFDAKKVDGTLPSETMASAEVLWQNVTCPVDKVLYEDGKIYFKTVAGKSGNAVVALKSADGKICWSWHIWVAGTTVGTNTFGSYIFMDRNLGATALEGKDARGLNYEWGRKDPFPGAVSDDTKTSLDRLPVVPDDAIKNVKEQNGKTIEWTIQNPSSYVSGSDNSGKEDWYNDGSDDSKQNNTLWGDGADKSIYDPCPYGYRVPSKSAVDGLVTEVKKGTFVKWDGVTISDVAYFPFSGWWQRKHYEVELCNVGTQGRIWSCTAHETDKTAYVFHYQESNSLVQVQAQVRRWGCNVRCVKINE